MRPGGPDPWSRTDYRRLIGWEGRIEREGPALRRWLSEAPERSVLDLGCGTGEHVAWFARQGARALGIDRSETMVEQARDHQRAGRGRFVLGDLLDAADDLQDEAPFGLAICLGNVLPHLESTKDLQRLARTLHRVLRPGGLALVQALNYERLRAEGTRALPVNVRDEDDGRSVAFVRLLTMEDERHVRFFPTTLELRSERDPPVELVRAQEVRLRTWTGEEVRSVFESASLRVTLHGDLAGAPFGPRTSSDLVVVARRQA